VSYFYGSSYIQWLLFCTGALGLSSILDLWWLFLILALLLLLLILLFCCIICFQRNRGDTYPGVLLFILSPPRMSSGHVIDKNDSRKSKKKTNV